MPSSGCRGSPRKRPITRPTSAEGHVDGVKASWDWGLLSCKCPPIPPHGTRTDIFNSLLFCATTVLSIYSVKYHEWNGRLPGYEHPSAGGQNIDPDKAAFSTNMHDEEAYAHIPMNDQDDHDDPYAPGPSSAGAYGDHTGAGAYDDHTSTAYAGAGRHPSQGSAYSGRSGSTHENPFRQQNPFDDDTAYAGAGSTSSVGMPYVPPAAHEEFDHDEPVKFPAADYDRVTR